jgi:hypothetical protein
LQAPDASLSPRTASTALCALSAHSGTDSGSGEMPVAPRMQVISAVVSGVAGNAHRPRPGDLKGGRLCEHCRTANLPMATGRPAGNEPFVRASGRAHRRRLSPGCLCPIAPPRRPSQWLLFGCLQAWLAWPARGRWIAARTAFATLAGCRYGPRDPCRDRRSRARGRAGWRALYAAHVVREAIVDVGDQNFEAVPRRRADNRLGEGDQRAG